jgi:hypothetical protein
LDLGNPDDSWRLSQGIQFTFEQGSWIGIGGRAYIVGIEAEDFRRRFSIPDEIPVWGPYTGDLSNRTDDLRVYRSTDDRLLLSDQVKYTDLPPWPSEADTGNVAMNRTVLKGVGSDPGNWLAGTIEIGRHYGNGRFGHEFAVIDDAEVFGAPTLGRAYRQASPGDANGDGVFNSSDLVQVFQQGKYQTGETADWLAGDWNYDGRFDSSDLVIAFTDSEYSG